MHELISSKGFEVTDRLARAVYSTEFSMKRDCKNVIEAVTIQKSGWKIECKSMQQRLRL